MMIYSFETDVFLLLLFWLVNQGGEYKIIWPITITVYSCIAVFIGSKNIRWFVLVGKHL